MVDVTELLKKIAEENKDKSYYVEPGKYSFDPSAMGLTKLGAAKQLVGRMPWYARNPRFRNLDETGIDSTKSKYAQGVREDMREALNILSQIPNKTLSRLKKIDLTPPLKGGENYAGSLYNNKTVVLRPESAPINFTFPKSLTHEVGHAVTEDILNKKGYKLLDVYQFLDDQLEGVAEYWSVMKTKQPPIWGHGERQEKYFSQIPTRSKNVEYNMMRYLDDLLAKTGMIPGLKLDEQAKSLDELFRKIGR